MVSLVVSFVVQRHLQYGLFGGVLSYEVYVYVFRSCTNFKALSITVFIEVFETLCLNTTPQKTPQKT